MHNRSSTRIITVLFLMLFVLVLSGTLLAQDDAMIEPLDLSTEPVVLEFSTGASGPPAIELLTDGRMTFRITSSGEVTGTLNGTILARVSEVTPNPSPPFHPVTVMFTIETGDGVLEGYYAGSFYLPEGAEQATISASGQILSVSGAYADLYLADVFVSGQVQFVDGRSIGDTGTMTITAR